MPFVIPRVYVPADTNTASVDKHAEYEGKPSVEQLETYREWLAGEISNVDKAIEITKYGADVVTDTHPHPAPATDNG